MPLASPSFRKQSRAAVTGSNTRKVSISRARPSYQSAPTGMDCSSDSMIYDLPDHAVIPWTIGYDEDLYYGQPQHYSNTMSMDTALLSVGFLSDQDLAYTESAAYGDPVGHAKRYHVGTICPPLIQAERPSYSVLPVESPALIPRYMECPTGWQQMLYTPPPEPMMYQDDLDLLSAPDTMSATTDTASGIEYLGPSKIQFSATRPSHRPIRSASERNVDGHSPVSADSLSSPDLQSNRRNNPRNDPRYDTKPDKDGLYHCPFVRGEGCNHAPTKQKCIYAKNLDSHLKPYNCKFKDENCRNLRFSSNACLFRHEREMHGLHNHGLNPYLCRYTGCERARPDNGFPRRWNQRDHMKRVHGWEEPENSDHSPTGIGDVSRRRRATAAQSVPMKKTSSTKTQGSSTAGSRQAYGRQGQRGLVAEYSRPLVSGYYHRQHAY